jgi:hypothetical protein
MTRCARSGTTVADFRAPAGLDHHRPTGKRPTLTTVPRCRTFTAPTPLSRRPSGQLRDLDAANAATERTNRGLLGAGLRLRENCECAACESATVWSEPAGSIMSLLPQFSSPDWTRTSNPSINSRMLCQLSYRGPLQTHRLDEQLILAELANRVLNAPE